MTHTFERITFKMYKSLSLSSVMECDYQKWYRLVCCSLHQNFRSVMWATNINHRNGTLKTLPPLNTGRADSCPVDVSVRSPDRSPGTEDHRHTEDNHSKLWRRPGDDLLTWSRSESGAGSVNCPTMLPEWHHAIDRGHRPDKVSSRISQSCWSMFSRRRTMLLIGYARHGYQTTNTLHLWRNCYCW